MFANRKHSAETKLKMRDKALGRVNSPETRKKISKNHARAWVGRKHTPESKAKIGSAHKGKKVTELTCKRLSQAALKSGHSKREGNPNWKGGITPFVFALRTSTKMKIFNFDVMRRDRFSCQECGDDKGGNLQVDHIIPFSYLINQLRIEAGIDDLYEKALDFPPLWDVSNGRTLCIDCHKKTDTYGTKARNFIMLK